MKNPLIPDPLNKNGNPSKSRLRLQRVFYPSQQMEAIPKGPVVTVKRNLDSVAKLFCKNEQYQRLISKHVESDPQQDWIDNLQARSYREPPCLESITKLIDKVRNKDGTSTARDRSKRDTSRSIEAVKKNKSPRNLKIKTTNEPRVPEDSLNNQLHSKGSTIMPTNTPRSLQNKTTHELKAIEEAGLNKEVISRGTTTTLLPWQEEYQNFMPHSVSTGSPASKGITLLPLHSMDIPALGTSPRAVSFNPLNMEAMREIDVSPKAASDRKQGHQVFDVINRIGLSPKKGALQTYLNFSSQATREIQEGTDMLATLYLPKLAKKGTFIRRENSQEKKINLNSLSHRSEQPDFGEASHIKEEQAESVASRKDEMVSKPKLKKIRKPLYRPNKMEGSSDHKTQEKLQKLYWSCRKLQGKIGRMDKQLISKENAMNKKFIKMNKRLHDVVNLNFIPGELMFDEGI